ncbi:hypothetical protein Dda_5520 [Drechslerella dactyloides]|uniref:Uncharacterized protein n=1 Tax=Drechslerella dactyloides TaxID=74499 RepID=A0AAD6J0G9_DREDA|nr:hypothetical protein Dda_5520 [Drechslerella dactyloides]
MVQYSLTVRNLSADRTAFILFTEPPKVDPNDNSTIYTNVFQLSDPANNDGHGTAIFKIERKTYAICLTSKKPLGAGTNVTTSDYQEVNIGTYTQNADIVNVTYDQSNQGGDLQPAVKAATANTPAGGFVMTTTTGPSWSYPTNNNFSIGVGAMDSGSVQPLAIFKAKPNKTYNIFPITKFYVAPAGDYQAGDIIDVKTIPTYYTVEFKDGATSIVVDYASDNAFHPSS